MGRLLILDDEPAVGEMVTRIAKRSGTAARYCRSVDEFFRELEQSEPSHLLIDVVMPEFEGVEVLSRLARSRTGAGVIITSGLGGRVLQSAERAARARGLQVIGVLPKPFSVRALRTLLAAPPAQSPRLPAARVGPPVLEAAELARALENDEFFLEYQPKWLLAERRVLGFEALVRWAHPTRGIIGPDDFIAFLEDMGQIGALTDRILQHSLAWFAGLGATQPLCLEVNVSGSAIGADLAARMSRFCERAQVARERLVLEVTDTSQLCDSVGATEVLNRLRIRGFGLAIDDFNLGYASLSQLAAFPFTELKIDRSFVASMRGSGEMRSIVHACIGLAKRVGMITVAEGVEDSGTMDMLAGMGCDAVQGYAIAHPMDPEQAGRWLKEQGT